MLFIVVTNLIQMLEKNQYRKENKTLQTQRAKQQATIKNEQNIDLELCGLDEDLPRSNLEDDDWMFFLESLDSSVPFYFCPGRAPAPGMQWAQQ